MVQPLSLMFFASIVRSPIGYVQQVYLLGLFPPHFPVQQVYLLGLAISFLSQAVVAWISRDFMPPSFKMLNYTATCLKFRENSSTVRRAGL